MRTEAREVKIYAAAPAAAVWQALADPQHVAVLVRRAVCFRLGVSDRPSEASRPTVSYIWRA